MSVAIPSAYEMYVIVLQLMADGKEYSRPNLVNMAKEKLGLSEEESNKLTSSGALVYETRVSWAVTHLNRAEFITRIRRGIYVINETGRDALEFAKEMDAREFAVFLQKHIEKTNPWNRASPSRKAKPANKTHSQQLVDKPQMDSTGTPNADTSEETLKSSDDILEAVDSSGLSPQEQIDALTQELNDVLAEEILALIMEREPTFFEQLVVDLLEKMGYGKGKVTKPTSDGGVDGLITTDVLGFRPICTQAKRYSKDNKVSRGMLQAFVGALNGISDGVFITTSSFTKEAQDYANKYPNATIALIDGKRLAELMIEYDLGVATERVVKIKRIDSDYFEE